MSAYLVDPGTVDLLLTAAPPRLIESTLRDVYSPDAAWGNDHETRNTLGRYLLSVNARSVAYRYPADAVESLPGTQPGEWLTGMTYHPMPAYDYRPTRIGAHGYGSIHGMSQADARRVIGAAHCYRYQSCELPEWDATPAARFIVGVIDHAAGALADGWEYTREEDKGGRVHSLVG